MEYHTFSIVIMTYNRAGLLVKAIESALKQDYPRDKYELIIVDNGSTDDTAEVVGRCTKASPVSLSYYVEKRRGVSYARNLGIEKSRLEYMAQLDDDEMACPDWLAAINQVINERHALVVGGRVDLCFPDGYTPPDWFNHLKHPFGVSYGKSGKRQRTFRVRHPLYLSGGNIAYARRLFDHFGVYRTDLGRVGSSLMAGEETFFLMILDRNDIPMYYTQDAGIHHHVGPDRINKRYLGRKARWAGITSAYVSELFFGYDGALEQANRHWRDLRSQARQVARHWGSAERFSHLCAMAYTFGFIFKTYVDFVKHKLSGRTYMPPQVTWTTRNWVEEISRWPDSPEKYEQLAQLCLDAADTEGARQALAKLETYGLGERAKTAIVDWEQLYAPLRRVQYERFVKRVRETIEAAVPPAGTVLVISKGDDELLKLKGRRVWHFPRNDQGAYAGCYPADSAAAIAHLEALREKGAEYLAVPGTALWWLDHYDELNRHLMRHYRVVARESDSCLIFAL